MKDAWVDIPRMLMNRLTQLHESWPPEHLHSGRKIIEISSFLAGSIFNDGQHSVLKIMNEFRGLPGKNSQAYANYANKCRVKKQNKEASLASKEARTLRKQKRTAEDEWHEETEGLMYASRIAD